MTETTVTEKVTHTPAPWHDVRPNMKMFGVYRIATVATHLEQLFDSGSAAGVDAVTATDAANARLIAAAPGLLAACKLALVRLDDGTPVSAKIADHVRAAIAKAEGAL